ncbi:MAG TPA: type II secretion system F family protein [Acidimicrobiales bacterium]|nr:type II secretion system F family protein [Acidimicrobiales bacterium]
MSGEVAALAAGGAVLAASAGVTSARWWIAGARARHRLLERAASRAAPMPGRVRDAFGRAGLAEEADRLLRLWLAGLFLTLTGSLLVPGVRLLLAGALVAGPVGLLLATRRETRRRRAQLPEALDAVAAGLRSGLALPAAIAGAASVGAPLGDELGAMARDVDAGRPLAEAIERWQAATPDDPLTGLAAAALTVATEVGGPGARAVDGAAASLRERLGSEAETAALATQGRASAAVLTLAPLGFAFLLTSLDPAAGRFLLGTPVGWLCITIGLGLDGLGAWWMARLVRRAR